MGDISATMESGRLHGETVARLYPASWIDRLTGAIARLPGPGWPYYLIMWLVPVAAITGAKWIDGTYSPPFANPLHIALASGLAYVMATVALLDRVAGRALVAFRPASTLSPEQYRAFEYRLTTLPARPALLWTLVPLVLIVAGMGSIALFAPSLASAEATRLGLFTSPLSAAVDGLYLVIWPPLLGIWDYHTYHQLKVVDELYTRHTKIDPFYLKPLYAFSRLTAFTAISLLIPTYFGPATVPGYLQDPVFLADTAGLLATSVIAVAIFVVPLVGIHHQLVAEKERLVAASARRIEIAIAEFDRRIDAGELQAMDMMKDTMDALVTKQNFIERIPTWPWSIETSRLVATAIALPIVLYAIQRLIEAIFR